MKGKQLRKAVLLGMAMSMAVWTTGMAEDVPQITTSQTVTESAEDITVTNTPETGTADSSHGAIDIRDVENIDVSLTTNGEGNSINVNSTGYGILTSGG